MVYIEKQKKLHNIDFSCLARQCSSDLIQFMDANDLLAKDPDIEFTYESDDRTHRSRLDMYLYLPI